ncbi:MAG: glyoxalase, partial [Lachnospiraceae bacterium]
MELEDYIEECAKVFLDEQTKLFDEPVASNIDEAKSFLEESFAQVFDSIDDVREYLDELGMDVDGMDDDEIEEQL